VSETEQPATEHEPTLTFFPVDESGGLGGGQEIEVPGLKGYALVSERGPHAGLTWVLKQGATGVGRHPEDEIFLDDITVSRHHARFLLEADLLTVEDLGSTNGTYVNGVRRDRAALRPGDLVLIGKYHLAVARGDG